MAFPKPSAEAKSFWESALPKAPDVTVRPMFGNLAAFVNGNMFSGTFGDRIMVRLGDAERAKVVAAGGAPFEPIPGRVMREYVELPAAWGKDGKKVREWLAHGLRHASALPPKRK